MASKLAYPVAIALALLLLAAPGAGASLIAPAAACPNQAGASVSASVQEQAMRCMTDFARAEAGFGALADSTQLDLSSQAKGADVLRCDSFSHTACGREFAYWMRQAGYLSESCWRVGENLAWGTGSYGTVRSIFKAWMRSPGHRQNILGDYETLGLSRQTGELDGRPDTIVWTAHFGSHCGAPAS